MSDTPVVVVVRDPDYSNEYKTFDGDVHTYDIDLGRSDLSDSDECREWAVSHCHGILGLIAEGHQAAAVHVEDIVKEQVANCDGLSWATVRAELLEQLGIEPSPVDKLVAAYKELEDELVNNGVEDYAWTHEMMSRLGDAIDEVQDALTDREEDA